MLGININIIYSDFRKKLILLRLLEIDSKTWKLQQSLNKPFIILKPMSLRENAKVMVRVRPLLNFEDEPAWMGTEKTIQCMDTKSIKTKLNKSMHTSQINFSNYQFHFQKVIQSPSTSQKIHKYDIRPMIERTIIQNVHSTIVAYGQTCSGKTYTLLGVKQAPGFIPCTFRDIFQILRNSNIKEKYMNCTVKLSYIELYNEKLNDLLNPKNKNLKIIHDQNWGSEVQNSTKIEVDSFDECLEVLDLGEENRKYAAKENHQRSSRSHTILKIYIEKRDHNLGFYRSVINIIDLAGSERLSQTSINTKQTGHINKSLFQFSNVIAKLSENTEQFIPYRDSKLTRMLQSSLTKNCLITVVFCISPAVLNLQESISTLRLASKAKSIKYQIEQEFPTILTQQQIKQLYKNIAQKDKKIKELTQKIEDLNKKVIDMEKQHLTLRQNYNHHVEDAIEDLSLSSPQKFPVIINITAVLDHQNFLFSMDGEDFSSQNQEFQDVREQFVEKSSQLYEEYTRKILGIKGLKNQFVQIEQFCFMGLCYDRETQLKQRIQLLQNMKIELQGQQNIKYKQTLENYISMMRMKLDKNQSEKTLRKNKINHQPQILEHSTIYLRESEQVGRVLYAWGSKKDGRVFQSQQKDTFGVHALEIGQIAKVNCGTNHTLITNQQGKVYGWGKNDLGQICSTTKKNHFVNIPREIKFKTRIIEVGAGWGHSLALSQNKQVYSWGFGEDGQLGHGNTLSMPSPIIVSSLKEIKKIYAGHSHSGFIDEDNNYYACGFNKDYRLMLAQSKQVLTPTKIALRGIQKAALGVTHSCLLTFEGKIFCGGVGTNGQLGMQLNSSITGYQVVACAPKNFQEEPIQKICPLIQVQYFSEDKLAVDISCGENFTAVITADNQLYTFGKSSYDRLGHQQKGIHRILENVDKVSVGYRHGFAWNRSTKEVYGWGFNMHNQLGILKAKDLKAPQLINSLSSKQILEISSGFFHSIASGK